MESQVQVAAPAARGRMGRLVKLVLGFGLSAVFAVALLSRVRLDLVGAALARAHLGFVAAALAAIAVAYALRAQRWAVMLRGMGGRVTFGEAAVPLMGCVALNNVLPLRAGDVVRIVAFRRLTKLAPSMQLGSLVLERLLDIASVMAILAATAAGGRIGLRPDVARGLQWVGVATVLAVAIFLISPGPIRRVVRIVEARAPRLRPALESLLRLSTAIAALSRPLLLLRLSALSVCAWLFEGLAYIAVGLALGVGHSVAAGLLALCLGTLATSIPSSPGYVGTFHYFAALALTQLGTAAALATAFAILIHGLLWASTTATGFLLLLLSGERAWRPGGARAEPLPHEGRAS